MSRGRICFYSEYAWPLISRVPVGFSGGAESQVTDLARGLAARGYDVSLVTCDYGQPAEVMIDGVRVLRAFRPGRGIPVVRFFHPRLTRAAQALFRAEADLYYVNGSGMPAGLSYEVAKWRGAKFLLAIMTDYDVMADPPGDVGITHRGWFLRSLRGADRVLAQTEHQRAELERNFGVPSRILPNVVEIPERAVDPAQDGLVIWLATYKPIKRPEWFLALAREMPSHRFVMAGVIPPPPLTRESWDAAVRAGRELPNLEVLGFQDRAQRAELFRRASLLVHTSPVEGFSNVLLEAWAAGLPTVAGVNPDGLVTREGLGAHAPDYATLCAQVERLMADPAARREAGARARRYAESHHSPAVVYDVLEDEFQKLLAPGAREAASARTPERAR